MLSGLHAVEAALRELPDRVRRVVVQADARPHPGRDPLVELARAQGIAVRSEDIAWFRAASPDRNPQGIVAELAPFPYRDLEDVLAGLSEPDAVVLVLDGVTDPHNLGAILRSASFFGAHAVIIGKDRAAEVTVTAERTAVGAASRIPIVQVTNVARTLGRLKEAGFWVYGTTPDGEVALADADLTGRVALVLGAEGGGMRRLVRERCDVGLKLEAMGPMQSLNVSVFAGVVLYETSRKRKPTPGIEGARRDTPPEAVGRATQDE
jgi:23S rRNA (guanosine2251-2'-O)-methyltransferase